MTRFDRWMSRQPTWLLLAYTVAAIPLLWAADLADRLTHRDCPCNQRRQP